MKMTSAVEAGTFFFLRSRGKELPRDETQIVRSWTEMVLNREIDITAPSHLCQQPSPLFVKPSMNLSPSARPLGIKMWGRTWWKQQGSDAAAGNESIGRKTLFPRNCFLPTGTKGKRSSRIRIRIRIQDLEATVGDTLYESRGRVQPCSTRGA